MPQTTTADPGRGGLILTFGILSIVLLGPILGIPAWVMGHGDLKKIRAGIIAISAKGLTQAGMVLGIIGTFFGAFSIVIVGIAIAVGLSMFSSQSISSNKDAMINDLNNLFANAYQYRIRPTSMGGGGGTYNGYSIPDVLSYNENGSYSARVQARGEQIKFTAKSVLDETRTIEVIMDNTGRPIMRSWVYGGDFQ